MYLFMLRAVLPSFLLYGVERCHFECQCRTQCCPLCFGKNVLQEEVGDLQPCQLHVEHGAFALQGREDDKKHELCHEKAEDLQMCCWERSRQTLFMVQLHV